MQSASNETGGIAADSITTTVGEIESEAMLPCHRPVDAEANPWEALGRTVRALSIDAVAEHFRQQGLQAQAIAAEQEVGRG
ncbi:MAG: hypothetical protein ACPGXK_03025 [Phycisphaerae bacterium]